MLRSYIAGVVKFCEKKGNAEKLTKWLGSYLISQPEKNKFPCGPLGFSLSSIGGFGPIPGKTNTTGSSRSTMSMWTLKMRTRKRRKSGKRKNTLWMCGSKI